MTQTKPTLHFLCGKAAAGKSTLAKSLSAAPQTVLIEEDIWLKALYADELSTVQDYLRCTRKLRSAMTPHIVSLLEAGLSVVLDFSANTVKARDWPRRILGQVDADHVLHVLNLPDDLCLERLRARNAKGEHPFAATEEQFHALNKMIEFPTAAEGFVMREYPG
ncbi:putative kinase [Rubricella aquisinus]|uniref:Putative kinase n=1 Tax=Rubricella aquisinus TaxID=2028108 RepID=A0A840WKW1_9RHOB|nr:ATP-binding protein [Rubricella aquisinus]MBB5515151.1 putative kinase [Rubricella aquisinus]